MFGIYMMGCGLYVVLFVSGWVGGQVVFGPLYRGRWGPFVVLFVSEWVGGQVVLGLYIGVGGARLLCCLRVSGCVAK